jgi:hypothetical protein
VTDALSRQIQDAFAATPYPGDERIGGFGYFSREVQVAFRGHGWRDLSAEVLFWHRWDIFLLTPEAFRYYAPAYMLASLYYHDEMDSLPDNLLFCLTPQREEYAHNYFAGELNDYFSRRAAQFNAAERAAVLAFVEDMAEQVPARSMLYDIQLVGKTLKFWRVAAART